MDVRGGADLSSESHIVNGSVKDASLMLETLPPTSRPLLSQPHGHIVATAA